MDEMLTSQMVVLTAMKCGMKPKDFACLFNDKKVHDKLTVFLAEIALEVLKGKEDKEKGAIEQIIKEVKGRKHE